MQFSSLNKREIIKMICENCKKLMVRKKPGEEESVCMIDGRIVSRIIECSEHEEREPKKVKKF